MEACLNRGVSDADHILVSGLELDCHIGVPEEERARSQRLTVSLRVYPDSSFASLDDEIERAVDYFVLTRRMQEVAAERSRKLVETLVEDLAAVVVREFPVRRVEVELRKYILSDAEFVGVRVVRER